MKINSIILAYGASLDQRNGSMSLINVIEGLKSNKFPVAFHNLILVVLFRKKRNEPRKNEVELNIVGPKVKISQHLKFDFSSSVGTDQPFAIRDELAFKLFINIQKIEVKEAGDMKFIIKHNNIKLGEYEITVGNLNPSEVTNLPSSTS